MSLIMPGTKVPLELAEVFVNFRTAELSTIARDGTPVTVEVLPLWQPSLDRFLVTAAIGLPHKAYNARRNPHVSLLYSDPTASGLDHPPIALVQGDATVSDVTTWDDELAECWRVVYTKQPNGLHAKGRVGRWLTDWYFIRVKIHITPTRIRWWPNANQATPPLEVVA